MGKASKKKKKPAASAVTQETLLQNVQVPKANSLLDRQIVRLLSVAALGLLVYVNTLFSPFLFDDLAYIADSQAIRSLRYFISFYDDLSNIIIYVKTRYITHLSFALNYAVNGLAVWGYHSFNIAIHVINALLVYRLVSLTFKTPAMRLPSADNLRRGRQIAFFSAIVFVCHPVQIQAVTYITQRFASLATLFYLLSVTLYIAARVRQEEEISPKGFLPPARALLLYIFALISTVLAMKSKEIAFTLPLVIALYEFMFFSGPLRRRAVTLVPYLLTLPLIPLAMISSTRPAGDLAGEVSEAARSLSSISRTDYLLTQFRVIVTYIRLYLFPVNQNLDYDYPVYHTLLSLPVFLSFLLLTTVLGLGIYIFLRYGKEAPLSRLIAFGIFWFFITLSVESSIIPITDIIFEHRAYLPSAGLFITVAAALIAAKDRMVDTAPQFVKAVIPMFALFILFLSVAAFMRNTVWRNDLALWSDVVAKSPLKERGHNNLGVAYFNRGMINEAIEQYRTALRLDPKSVNAYHNFGNALYKKGMLDEAVEKYETALQLDPKSVNAHNNLGVIYFDRGMFDQAEEHYRTALEINPFTANANSNLGNVYLKKGMVDQAIEQYQIALQINPGNINAHTNLGVAYAARGMTDQAIEQYRTAVQMDPNNIDARNNLGMLYYDRGMADQAIEQYRTALLADPKKASVLNNYGNALTKKGQTEQAIEQYGKALASDPGSADTYNNLGLAYFKMGKVDQAIEQYRAALRINPKHADAHFNLSAALDKMGLKAEAEKETTSALQSLPDLQQALKMLESSAK